MTEPLTPSALADAFRLVRDLHSKPMATAMKVGQTAWPKVKERLGTEPEPSGFERALRGSIGSPLGIPVHVLEPNTWPPNLVAIVDQEGNAMQAWIIND